MFWVAFYGCLLAEVIPVPIEVPLSRQDAGSQQIGFLLGSCGVSLALTSEVCLKGLPKTPNGEIVQFRGSVSSCDAFLNVFQSHGLRPEVICPCATSPEALTVAIRRPGTRGAPLPARAILSMGGLSHGVIRVNTEDKNSALTVQDVGHIMPGDEIGEIVINSRAGGTMYYGLPGVTKNTFEVFQRLIFLFAYKIIGSLFDSRNYPACLIAVFSVTVFYDERIVIVAEQRPDASEEDSFQWMSRVLQAIDSIHQVGLYCLALVPANTLPKTPLGGIHICETKQSFLDGNLHPCNILMCPHTCVTNMPKPRQKLPVDVGPASMLVGNLVAGKRIAQATGRELGVVEDQDLIRKQQLHAAKPAVLAGSSLNRDSHIYSHTSSCLKLCSGEPKLTRIMFSMFCSIPRYVKHVHAKTRRVKSATASKHVQYFVLRWLFIINHDSLFWQYGSIFTILFAAGCFSSHSVSTAGIDLIAAFYGCLYAGVIPVTVSKAACILTTQPLMRILRSREAAASVNVKTWPTIIDTGAERRYMFR
ncbi:hypothetical protein GOODEAATRI_006890 [Goodea atripinnis]|uniref:Uncharacterized protein n=1 Tax=Goodea atripinnis TaxID=208336 RepID=A0ABV0MFU2_9TELE